MWESGMNGACKQERHQLFTQPDSDRTRKNGFKLNEGKFRLYIRRKFFTKKMVRYWNRSTREAVDALSLEAFKAKLMVSWAA